MTNSYQQQQIDLIAENEALKAQVNMLGEKLHWISHFMIEHSEYELFKKLLNWGSETDSLLSMTPKQCLNSVKADAIEEFFKYMIGECLGTDNGVDAVLDSYTNDNLLTPVKEYYVDKLRANNEKPT